MAPQYKLIYFNGRGASEPARWCFAYGGTVYEDYRVEFNDWPALKPNTPFGQLPVLEVDGRQVAQSLAVTRFVARKNGLTGKDDFEAAQADSFVDYVADAAKHLEFMFTEQDEKKKTAQKEVFLKETVQPYLQGLQRHLTANNNGEGFFVGDKPTWADLVVVCFLDRLKLLDSTVLDKYPILNGLVGRVHNLKGIKEWLVKRPVTEY